jgi:hypothetical protein
MRTSATADVGIVRHLVEVDTSAISIRKIRSPSRWIGDGVRTRLSTRTWRAAAVGIGTGVETVSLAAVSWDSASHRSTLNAKCKPG